MEMSKSSSLVLERVEWMPLSTHSVNSVMVETLKTCDVSEPNYSGGNGLNYSGGKGLRDRNVVCVVKSMLSGEPMYGNDLSVCLSYVQSKITWYAVF